MSPYPIHADLLSSFAFVVARELHHYVRLVFAASMLALLLAPNARADLPAHEKSSREHLIKAAILFNLAKSASWPDVAFNGDSAPLRMCVLGRNSFGPALDTLNGKYIGQREVVSLAIEEVGEAELCHVLWVSDSETAWLPAIFEAVAGLPVMTVAAIDRFALMGGIIGVAEVEGRSRLEVNMRAARKAGLVLASNLLRLAETVDGETVDGETAAFVP